MHLNETSEYNVLLKNLDSWAAQLLPFEPKALSELATSELTERAAVISCVDLGGIEACAVGAALVCRRACRLPADGAKGFELSDPSSAKGFEALEPGVAVRGSLEKICRETPAGITHTHYW